MSIEVKQNQPKSISWDKTINEPHMSQSGSHMGKMHNVAAGIDWLQHSIEQKFNPFFNNPKRAISNVGASVSSLVNKFRFPELKKQKSSLETAYNRSPEIDANKPQDPEIADFRSRLVERESRERHFAHQVWKYIQANNYDETIEVGQSLLGTGIVDLNATQRSIAVNYLNLNNVAVNPLDLTTVNFNRLYADKVLVDCKGKVFLNLEVLRQNYPYVD